MANIGGFKGGDEAAAPPHWLRILLTHQPG